jgi:hypothetical protein
MEEFLQETYIKPETALLAKEKGFWIKGSQSFRVKEEGGFDSYSWLGLTTDQTPDVIEHRYFNELHKHYLLCTLDQLQRWLRIKHRIHVCPSPKVHYPDGAVTSIYHYDIYIGDGSDNNINRYFGQDGTYGSYEEALEAGMVYALKELIK